MEYKRSKPKPEPFDEIQLCAQALCLEEMTAQTLHVINQVRELLVSGITPPPEYGKRCKVCSLVEICQPKLMEKDRSVGYVEGLFAEDG